MSVSLRLPQRAPSLLAAAVGLLASAACERTPPPAPPGASDIVFVVVDTLRYDAVFGDRRVPTPNIDRLARDGVVFPRAFSHAPMTLPSHTAMFSSRPPVESGVLCNSQDVPEDLPLLAEHLQAQGYRTVAVISLGTLRRTRGSVGLTRGFDVYDLQFWDLDVGENVSRRLREQLADYRELVPRAPGPEDGGPGRATDAAGVPRQGPPLFLFAHFSDPHSPYRAHEETGQVVTIELDGEPFATVDPGDAPQWIGEVALEPGRHRFELRSEEPFRMRRIDVRGIRWLLPLEWTQGAPSTVGTHFVAEWEITEKNVRPDGRYSAKLWVSDLTHVKESARRYALEVEHVDRYVGELIADLEEAGLYEDSLLVFVSDHGEAFGDHGHKGHVRTLYEEQIHVPLVVKPPAGSSLRQALERNRDRLVSLIDLTPTLLSACGLPPLPGQRGRSLLAEDLPAVEHVAETHEPEAPQDVVALRDERYKMIYAVDDDRFEMYDLVEDPLEASDRFDELAAERPGWPERLRAIARAGEVAAEGGEVGEEQAEMLRALGYIGSE